MLKKLATISPIIYFAAFSFAAEYDITENITDTLSSITVREGDTVNIQNSIGLSGGGFIDADGPAIKVDIQAGATVSVGDNSYFKVSGTQESQAELTFLGTETKEGFSASGATAETAGKIEISNAFLNTYNKTNINGNIPTFQADGFGSITFDNVQHATKSEQGFYDYNYNITLSDNANFTLKNGSVLGNNKYRNSIYQFINVSGDATLDILSGSKIYHYRWAGVSSPITLSGNGKINISGEGSQIHFESSGNPNPVNMSGNSAINISDGGSFYAWNKVEANLSENSKININDGGDFYIRQASDINLSDNAQINLSGTGKITGGYGTFNLSDFSSINSYGTGTVSGTVNLSDNASYNIINSENAALMRVASMSGNSSLNINNSTATTSGNISIGSETEGSNVSMNINSGSSLIIANNHSVMATSNGAIKATAATIKFNGLNSQLGANSGKLEIENAAINMTSTNMTSTANIYGAGDAVITIKDSKIENPANNWWSLNIGLQDNASLTFDNTVADYKLNTNVNRGGSNYIISGNSSLTIKNGSYFRPYQYSSNSKVETSGTSIFDIKDSGTTFVLDGSHGTACNIYLNIKESSTFIVEDSASLISSNGVLNLSVTENGTFSLRNSASSTFASGSANYVFDGGEGNFATFEIIGTGVLTKISSLSMSSNSKLKFIASADGISTLATSGISDFEAVLEIDFSNIVLSEGEHQFLLINSPDVIGTMLNYVGEEDSLEGFVVLNKRNEADSWSIDMEDNGLVLYYNAAVIPEPSVCAYIFATAAILFAIRRKRSK